MKNKLLPIATAALALLQVGLVLLSWIISSAMPSARVRSLLSEEGFRWFFGSFTDNISGPLLAWLLLFAVAYGAFTRSGIAQVLGRQVSDNSRPHRRRHAVYVATAVAVVAVVVVAMLAFVPHAPLLGISGRLFPGPFDRAIVPIVAATVTIVSVSYGLSAGILTKINDVFSALCYGIRAFAPVFLIYIFAIELYHMVIFVFFS